MDRIHDLTTEITQLEYDLACLANQISRQSTPIVSRQSTSQSTTSRRRNISPQNRRVTFSTGTGQVGPNSRDPNTSNRRTNVNSSDGLGNAHGASQHSTQSQGQLLSNSADTMYSRYRKNIVKPATYNGKSSWIDFKWHFDICAQLNEWSEDEKGLYLAVALREGAQAVLGNLPVQSRKNYNDLSKALEDRIVPSNQMDLYRAHLKDRKQKASESIPELGQDIRRLTNLAYAKAPNDVRETLATEYFIDSLHSSDMRLRVKQSRPKNLNEAICLAVELDAFNKEDKKRDEAGGFVLRTDADAPCENSLVRKMLEDTNKALSEMRREIKEIKDNQKLGQQAGGQTLPSQEGKPRFKCYFCGKDGHIKKKCRKFLALENQQNQGKTNTGTNNSKGERNKLCVGSMDIASKVGQSGLYIHADINGTGVKLLVDTGATVSLIAPRHVGDVPLESLNADILIADGSALSVLGTTILPIKIGSFSMTHKFIVADIGIDGILGLDFMKNHDCSVDIAHKTLGLNGQSIDLFMEGNVGCYRVYLDESLHVPARSEVLALCSVHDKSGEVVSNLGVGMVEPIDSFTKSDRGLTARTLTDSPDKVPVRIMNLHNESHNLHKGTVVGQFTPVLQIVEGQACSQESVSDIPAHLKGLYDQTVSKLSNDQRYIFKAFMLKYHYLFAKDDFDLGRAESIDHKINTSDTQPIKQAPRRLPEHMHEEVNKHIDAMLERKVIQPSKSPWSSPIILAKKKDGSTRFCVDYRRLNEVTIKDAYPLPLIQESLDHLSGARWFSTLDLCMGYWQVLVQENDRPKTAFASRRGLYEFSVMPFGLCNAPATFQRLMESVFRGLQFETCLVYLDDIIVTGKTFDNMIQNLSMVFDRLSEAGLKLKAKKCNLFASEVEYLGHVVTEAGITTSQDKIKAIADWPVPRNVTEVRSFLGLCSYYRRFVPDFASIASPLHKLTNRNIEFQWTDTCQRSFDGLRHALMSAPILVNPDFSRSFILDTDASDLSIGAVLSQNINGEEKVCAYASRSLSKTERKYCVTRKELLAVIHFVKHFRHILWVLELHQPAQRAVISPNKKLSSIEVWKKVSYSD
ncbi:hypothetical protein FSP39_022396 [Pinctada imbricata]|uniref:Uncharacterized protein n=1 Tax=Pinctada imbricata TaxID=66713 RepID=A0AA89BXW0_PINIB|nr:hypothetical protein FSP39_022396 [Pinctada imbricata]